MNIFSFANYLEGYWLYPIFHHLSTMQISLLFAVTGILFWFLYLTGENITIGNKIRLILGDGLNTLLWGKAPHSVDKSPRKPHLISKKKEWFDSDLTCHIRYITWPRPLQGYLSLTYHNTTTTRHSTKPPNHESKFMPLHFRIIFGLLYFNLQQPLYSRARQNCSHKI